MISVLLILSNGCLSRSIEEQGGEGLYQGRIIDSHAHYSAGRIDIAPDGVNIPADDPVMLQIYDSAAEHGLPVNLHVDAPYSKELGKALGHNRKTKIIWAHCGYADASLIRSMFEKHPNLFADISVLADPYKKHSVDMTGSDGTLKQEWKNLFEDFSHRLMLGSDMGKSKDRYMMTPKIMRHYRRLLFQLSQESAEDIAYKTILGLIRQDE